MRVLGQHLILEFYKCNSVINNLKKLSPALEKIVKNSGGRILETAYHKFKPQGISGIMIIAESHVAIHTWPEHKFAAVDVFTCSENMNLDYIVKELKKLFETKNVIIAKLNRGVIS